MSICPNVVTEVLESRVHVGVSQRILVRFIEAHEFLDGRATKEHQSGTSEAIRHPHLQHALSVQELAPYLPDVGFRVVPGIQEACQVDSPGNHAIEAACDATNVGG